MFEFEATPISRSPARPFGGGWGALGASAALHTTGLVIVAFGMFPSGLFAPKLVGSTQVVQAHFSMSATWSQPVEAAVDTPVIEIAATPVTREEPAPSTKMESLSTIRDRQPLSRLSKSFEARSRIEQVSVARQTTTPSETTFTQQPTRETTPLPDEPPSPQPQRQPPADEPIRKRPAPASTAAIASGATPDSVGLPDPSPPSLIFNRKPEYPADALRNGWEGRVLLKLRVAAEGHVENVTVLRSSGFVSLDAAARQAVESWQFSPGQQNGRPAATTVEQPIIFQLRGSR